MKKVLLLLLLVTLPAAADHGDCRITEAIVEPSPAWYGEEIDVRLRGECAQGAPPHSPRISVNGSAVFIDLSYRGGGVLVPSRWGERIHLGKLLPGTYQLVIRGGGEEWYRHTLVVNARPFEVVPMVGRAGDRVMIRGLHDIDCSVVGCDAVRFGGVPATPAGSDGSFAVVVPPHAPGLIDVTVRLGDGTTLTLPNGFRYGDPDEHDYERVLFPINYRGAGANGSVWDTEIAVLNTTPVPLRVEPLLAERPFSPGVPVPLPLLPAGGRGFLPSQNRDGGAFLYVPRGAEQYLAYTAHIINATAGGHTRGAEVPVVRASDTSSVIHLPYVPLEASSRATLRIYDFDAVPGRQVRGVARTENGAEIGFTATLRAQRISCPTTPCLQPTPGFVAIDLSNFQPFRNAGTIDLTIFGTERDARLWAFISVTENETQNVMLYTPQHRTPQQ